MNDLQHVKELGRGVPLPTDEELAPARARLVVALNAAEGAATRPAGRRRRLLPALAGGLAIAAAMVTVIVLAVDSTGGPPGQGGAPPLGQPSTGEPSARQLSAGPSSAGQPRTVAALAVLRQASVAALAQPFVEPRADQYLYLATRYEVTTRRAWLSVDGIHDSFITRDGGPPGEVIDGCRNGQRNVRRDGEVIGHEPCQPDPAYLPDAPTDAQAMLHYVQSLGGTPGTNSWAKNVVALATVHYLRPQARAALYDAAALIDGVEIVPDAVDGAGRPGVGVAWSYGGGRTVMVFDPNTHALLGFQDNEALVAATIVDSVGQRP